MANIRMSIIQHEDYHFDMSSKGKTTIGQQIDEYISQTLAMGSLIYEIKFSVEESEANKMLDSFHNRATNREAISEAISRK